MVASYNLWIWNAFFGPPDTLNDINVLDRSLVFDDIINGQAPQTTFIQFIPIPQGPKAVLFAQRQEAVRKDVERAFGVLQARFAIVKNPALSWDKVKSGKIMRACIILHNMIVENERDDYTQYDVSDFQQGEESRSTHVDLTYSTDIPTNIANQMGVQTRIRDRQPLSSQLSRTQSGMADWMEPNGYSHICPQPFRIRSSSYRHHNTQTCNREVDLQIVGGRSILMLRFSDSGTNLAPEPQFENLRGRPLFLLDNSGPIIKGTWVGATGGESQGTFIVGDWDSVVTAIGYEITISVDNWFARLCCGGQNSG
uniref:DDE Tnp4 domain-containing protein n=1 Tax=Brassica oleracea var. oleracea TaxID=109376 RepID=A0A0D3AQB0_BRAOL